MPALTALISVNGAVAALLPVVVVAPTGSAVAVELLIPLCFGAHAGSHLALTARREHLVADAAHQYDGTPFGFFEFAFVGVPL